MIEPCLRCGNTGRIVADPATGRERPCPLSQVKSPWAIVCPDCKGLGWLETKSAPSEDASDPFNSGRTE